MIIGVPREPVGESRVALVPESVKRLTAKGHHVLVESGAGAAAYFPDAQYQAAGAELTPDFPRLAQAAEVVVKIRPPALSEVAQLKPGAALIGLLQPLMQLAVVAALKEREITSFSLDALPRISRAQSMDVLSSQATVGGYRAIILAAQVLPKLFPMLMTAAGTVTPARVLVLGAGVAGLQAIATAKRLGAQVQAFDTRPAVQEQVASLGAGFLTLPLEGGEGQGGYASQLAEEVEAKERVLLAEPVSQADVVVSTAMVPGTRAPVLIDSAMVASMRPGSIIIDMAAESGGNCQLTQPGQRTVTDGGVTIEGATNLPGQIPTHASQLYSHNIVEFLDLLTKAGVATAEDGGGWMPAGDDVLKATCITHGGAILHAATLTKLQEQGGVPVVQQSYS